MIKLINLSINLWVLLRDDHKLHLLGWNYQRSSLAMITCMFGITFLTIDIESTTFLVNFLFDFLNFTWHLLILRILVILKLVKSVHYQVDSLIQACVSHSVVGILTHASCQWDMSINILLLLLLKSFDLFYNVSTFTIKTFVFFSVLIGIVL